MDEVQLCGDQSASAAMMSLIPRQHSLAVSGTPARTDIKDLMGSLRFLRVPVLLFDSRLWHRLQQAPMREAFEGIFRSIAIRTTKKEVASEFTIPAQTRYVVPIELSEIELHYYNDTLDRQRSLLGLPTDPTEARSADWILDRTMFRTCLTDLRQICTHIQVGIMTAHGINAPGRNHQRLQLGKELMTMDEALERMRKDHAAETLLASRQQVRHLARCIIDRGTSAVVVLTPAPSDDQESSTVGT
jgi:E3 ubiquitin-protein ligase SHPRH